MAILAALLVALSAAVPSGTCLGQSGRLQYVDAPVTGVVADIERMTAYRFLYRDALVSGKTVSFEADSTHLLQAFDAALQSCGLDLTIDTTRRQALITRVAVPDASTAVVLTGYVLDAGDGGRLLHATITWFHDGRLHGVTTGEEGVFHLRLPSLAGRDYLDLTASHVGYRPETVRVDVRRVPAELPIRLVPQDRRAQEVVVTGALLQTDLDTTFRHLLQPGLLSSFGEAGVMRSLQLLPSVSLTPALSQGLNVRGSRSDGFQVLLDGISIYNQHHFFGLFDAFNEDALQTVGFYYGVAPAQYQAPPGGTLSFVTRTGSQTRYRLSAGLSNTAFRATAEGPLRQGRASWLVSGRHSYLNALDWFNNDALIAQGLDVGRAIGTPGLANRQQLLPRAGTAAARFYDVHGKLFLEGDGGERWTLNGYAGGDDTRQGAERFMPLGSAGDGAMRVERRAVDTRNRWGNEAASLHHQRPVGSAGVSRTLAAVTHYYSRYAKDDFTYTHRIPPGPTPDVRPRTSLGPFSNENTLTEWKLSHQYDVAPAAGGGITGGANVHVYSVTYREASALRSAYARSLRSVQLDLFGQYDTAPQRDLALNLGLRSHYFSQGRFLRLSPRLQLRVLPHAVVSAGIGLSRNHQFLHQLYLPHGTSPDVWVMSTAEQPPASVDNVNGGLYLRLHPSFLFQAEAYHKRYRNLRQHETVAPARHTSAGSLLLDPWLHDNRAVARGLEVMARHHLGPLLWTHSYTLSRVEIEHPLLNDGRPFRADWDRTHQLTTSLQADLPAALTAFLTWVYATGTPNDLAYTDPEEPATLPDYHRLDASLRYRQVLSGVTVEALVSVFNLYDRDNTWYRAPLLAPAGDQPPHRPTFVNVDVYDLGLQPSFSVALHF